MIKIGKLELATGEVPGDLDDRLLAATGMSAAEIGRMIAQPCSAQTLAAAIEPMLAEPLHRVELARLIAAAGPGKVRPQVVRLFSGGAAPKKGRRGGGKH